MSQKDASYREAASMAQKMGAFLDQMGRARTVLEAAARAEQEEQSLKDRLKKAEDETLTAEGEREKAIARQEAADRAVEDATARAEQIIADAQERANELAQAQREREEAARETQKAREDAARELLADITSQAQEMESRVRKADEELQGLLHQIDQAKADARARFG